MSSRYWIGIAATVLLMFFLFSKDKKQKMKQQNSGITENISEQKKVLPDTQTQTGAVSSDLKVTSGAAAAVVSNEVRPISENVQKKFSAHIKLMTKCLALTNPQPLGEKIDPTLDNLMSNLKTSLGDVVVQMDDWSQTEFVDQGNIRKRVRVDYDYLDGTTPTRRLSMYQINSYGMPEIMNLTAEEVNNPNEAYIASLFEGRKVINEDKGVRSYFADGEELIFSLRNGQLQSVSINKGDRSFNCFNLDDENSSCTCP